MKLKEIKEINKLDKFKNDKFYLCNNHLPLQSDCPNLILLKDSIQETYNIPVFSLIEITKNDYYYLLSRMKNIHTLYYEQ